MQVTFPDGVTINVQDVIVLARKSQKIKGRAETSIESQDEDAREWAEEQALNVIATVPDIASGKKAMWDRPQARPWVTQPDLMTQYQGIVAAKHDRISRADWRDEGDLRRWAEDNHIALFLVEKELRWPPRQGAQYNDDVANWNREAENSNREWNASSRRWKRAHKKLSADNYLVGKPPYGYRVSGVNCKQTPCRCYENKIDDHKTLTIYEPEAKIVREVVRRYLAGESTQQICNDYPRWVPSTLASLLRNPSLAGRRQDKEGKTILRFEGIIPWQTHLELVQRLDSRAHRKGISPANTYMLTGILSCTADHAMYGGKGSGQWYLYACRYCKRYSVRVNEADAEVSAEVIDTFGHLPHMVMRIVPGENHFEEIARLRQDRNELDDLADDYEARNAELTAEIRRLIKLDKEQPDPDKPRWTRTGQTIAQHWDSLSVAGRRDWLKQNGWKVTAVKDDLMPNGWRLSIDAGWMADIGASAQSQSLGYPAIEYYRVLAELVNQIPDGGEES